jgi:hypothetical protein
MFARLVIGAEGVDCVDQCQGSFGLRHVSRGLFILDRDQAVLRLRPPSPRSPGRSLGKHPAEWPFIFDHLSQRLQHRFFVPEAQFQAPGLLVINDAFLVTLHGIGDRRPG